MWGDKTREGIDEPQEKPTINEDRFEMIQENLFDREPRVTRPALRYFGGKWRLAPWIIQHIPAHRCYVEPFGVGGGASVLLRKGRSAPGLDDWEIGHLTRVR